MRELQLEGAVGDLPLLWEEDLKVSITRVSQLFFFFVAVLAC